MINVVRVVLWQESQNILRIYGVICVRAHMGGFSNIQREEISVEEFGATWKHDSGPCVVNEGDVVSS